MPVGARRTQSLPSKYMLPSANMGEYESGRRKSAPAKPQGGGLFPLDEEGTYGRPPAGPAPAPPPAPKRERKTKIYSSYSVDSHCNVHAKKLAKVEEQREREIEEQRARRRRSSLKLRNVSASPSRRGSESRNSKSPEPRKTSNGAGNGLRKMTPNTGPGHSSYQSSSSARYSASSSHKISGGIREENEDYTYQENRRKTSGYSKYANDGLSSTFGTISLDGLRKPNIDSWDSMGILGLSSKMWSDSTRKRQENFMSSTGTSFLREENYNSYIM